MADARARKSAFSKLERLETTVIAIDPNTVTEGMIKIYIKSADDCLKKIEEAHLRIIGLLVNDDDIKTQEDILQPMEEKYQLVMAKLYNYQATTGAAHRSAQQLKLPDIQLPSFDGRYEDWPSFSDLFMATIEKNSSLSPSQKLQYLKSCTRGEAYNMVKTFTVTDSNYKEAWKLLSQRYSNPREIVNSLLKRLINQPQIKQESITSLQTLLNTTLESIRSLQVMGRPTDHWDDLICFIIIEKLDADTRAEWARNLKGSNPIQFTELQDFLEQHIRTLHAKGSVKAGSSRQQNGSQAKVIHHTSQQTSSSAINCYTCKENHQIYYCPKLKAMQPDKRFEAVKSTGVCLNCLKPGHIVKECTSSATCRRCSRKHNTFIHVDQVTAKQNKQIHSNQVQQSTSQMSTLSGTTTEHINILSSSLSSNSTTLLKTAMVNVLDSTSRQHQLRVFLDDGGEGSLIRESTLAKLGLPRQKTDVIISGVGDRQAFKSKWKTHLRLFSNCSNSFIDVELYSVPKVTGTINQFNANGATMWSHLADLQLADPTFQAGGEIDILIGADAVPYTLLEGLRKTDRHVPVAQNTIFGWVLFGNVSSTISNHVNIRHFKCELNETLRKFWEIEEIDQTSVMTTEEKVCEDHFVSTHKRDQTGRYVVMLPFKDNLNKMGTSREQAYRRLLSLERRFNKHPQYKQPYIDFMRQYEQLGHMELVPIHEQNKSQSFYLPHHFVLKTDSTTTKQRTVFDGSAKSTSGLSLNDTLCVGSTVQPSLFAIIIRFRLKAIALKADIEKMYRQFNVASEHRDFQRILWREENNQPIKEYRLNTVTYGTACAPFLATRSLNQLAIDEERSYPMASKALLTSFYVDDFLGSENSENEAKAVVHQLINVLGTAGMEIRKWCSNVPSVLSSLPDHMKEVGSSMDFVDGDSDSVKALGIKWIPATDDFMFTVNLSSVTQITKRHILSEVAKTFDPIGWISPITIKAKLLLQKIWLETRQWDEEVSQQLKEEWSKYQFDLAEVPGVRIPRCIVGDSVQRFELHGFSDSSEASMAASVYLKCVYNSGAVSVNLVASKTKVAPLKSVSLPKLELSAAKLLAELINTVKQVLQLEVDVFCWTDSTITLRWISSHSRRWKTFVANRVSIIQSLVPPEHWHHVKGEENPADLPSRGVSTSLLKSSSLWWHGPEWLKGNHYPVNPQQYNEDEVKREERSKQLLVCHISQNKTHDNIFSQYSSFQKLCRAASYWIRFVSYIKEKGKLLHKGQLSTAEVQNARKALIKWSQQVSFREEMQYLSKQNAVTNKSKLSQLCPFIDNTGTMRVGGRIQRSDLPYKTRHPIILANDHPISNLIINDAHLFNLHSGFNHTMATVRRQFWILRARDFIRHFVRRCVTCRRQKATAFKQLMGNLPTGRVKATKPFLHTGVDFAGPFNVKCKRGRYYAVEKCYFAIYICFATKAIHLESVNDLTSESFIASFERFVARRGCCAHLYSDNGTNFVGANKLLHHFLKQHQSHFQQQYCHRGTQWHFNPPSAPHHGGLWEAGVKSVKYHFNRVVGQNILTQEQFQTLLCKIEACLNSRPLFAISSDPTDLDALTPGHFLVGEPVCSIPEPDVLQVPQNRLSHWEAIRQMTQSFWKRWSSEYVTTLQQRFKWLQKRDNLQKDDLVVIMDDLLPITKWKLGRVISTHPGEDGLVKAVTVITALGECQRPITKLSPLLLQNDL